jgi:glutamate synthase (NADPH/NADH) small chain
MGKVTGFMDYSRVKPQYRPVEERVKDYDEVMIPREPESLLAQGARCMDCGIPFCHGLGCPLYNLIPEWNDLVYRGKWREAYERLEMTNNLPEITGRVCPAPCESSCTLSINAAPVSIKQIELAIIEYAWKQGWVAPRPPAVESGKRVAVIGSGPAGLAAAQQLRRAGHMVVVFEKSPQIGGILRYGIPDFKLSKAVIDRRLAQMEAEGVRFETDVLIGEDISARYLRKTFDVVVLTVGAGQPRDLKVPGRGLEGIHFAMDYLTRSNRYVNGEIEESDIISARGKSVLVIGGGDTGSDCVGTANRQGAAKVYQFEIMPKPVEWHEEHNPSWPEWPRILRSSTSHEEGCEREWGILTKSFSGHDVRVEKGHFARVDWEKSSERRGGPPELPDSGFELDVDLVLLAMGFVHVEHGRLITDLGLELDSRGNIVTTDYATSERGVFAAGDAFTGASLVVRAIHHGRRAAEAVNRYL